MATFATCSDLHRHPSTRDAGLAAISFCANDNVDDELHGVPLATSYIFGQCQFLKSLSHPNLCEYLDVIKGKRDRLFLVQEHHTNSLGIIHSAQENDESERGSKGQELARVRSWGAQILDGLSYLNTHGIAHRTLTLANVLLNTDGSIKLSNYGLHFMTKGGALVQFSVGDPHYLSPNTLGQKHAISLQDYSADLWSVGVILTEMFLGESFWRKDRSDVDELIGSLFALRKLSVRSTKWIEDCPDDIGINPVVLRFLQTGQASAIIEGDQPKEQSNRELEDFVRFLKDCLRLGPTGCQEPTQLRNHVFFRPYDSRPESQKESDPPGSRPSLWHQKPYIQSSFLPNYEGEVERLRQMITNGNLLSESSTSDASAAEHSTKRGFLCKLPLPQVFYLWKLAGGDVESQFRRNGRLVGTPAIQLLPKVARVIETKDERPPTRDIADLFSDVPCILPLENLEAEILKSIHEPNKDQFSWDTNYFLFSDPDEMNFLQNTMGHDKENVDEFLYPDSMKTTARLSRTFPELAKNAGSNADVPSLAQQPVKSRLKVPLATREKDLGYQYQRLSMFTDLLLQYPASRSEIVHHSKIDIPPLLRGKVWAAILGVVGDYQEIYTGYDKFTEKPTDRQIELDVPRCHQYNQLMFSPAGHEKMKRLLKCWVEANENQAYWQGLDSCCAPFLTLNFNDEALALASVQLFLPRFLKDMFLHDNSQVIHEYLAVFKHLLSFHDPLLSSHLDHIRFIPQLYAIPWFMTLFTHIFPLDKIYHLWDKILVGPSSLSLFVGIAILQQFRHELLRSEFNEAIGIFSGSFPEMDIEKCIEAALTMCRVTPPSTCWLSYDQETREMRKLLSAGRNAVNSRSNGTGNIATGEASAGPGTGVGAETAQGGKASNDQQNSRRFKEAEVEKRLSSGGITGLMYWWEEPLSIETMNDELAPRIHRSDFVRLRQQATVIDIRPEAEFREAHYLLSIRMTPSHLEHLVQILEKLKKSYLVVIANRNDTGPEFASALVQRGFTRVALLMGGIDALRVPEQSSNVPTSPSPSANTNTTNTTTTTSTSTICSCRVLRQNITVSNKVREEVVVLKCKTSFTQRRIRSTIS
ncbi:rab-GTPase-TBC domain-containing protein [Mortierella sp. GBAus27b]|nr:hypothetical protein BGX31_009065 [Mortierella sp. GBA43]KAI8360061.1 rab-GTPase-TBC domain-containing protein [Mortierella sp. GBAus27b]